MGSHFRTPESTPTTSITSKTTSTFTMQAAKDAVHKFTSKRGHDTTVDENVTGAVTKENIRPRQHEERTQALDREVRHEDPNHSKSQAAAHLAQFQSGSTTHETTRSAENKATVAGEHVHHHVHETVVPVVHKETIQPEVVHTTQPIHETHHAPSQHHGISALPMKSLDEFKSGGGTLDGHAKSAHEEYDGAPRPYNDKLSTTRLVRITHHQALVVLVPALVLVQARLQLPPWTAISTVMSTPDETPV